MLSVCGIRKGLWKGRWNPRRSSRKAQVRSWGLAQSRAEQQACGEGREAAAVKHTLQGADASLREDGDKGPDQRAEPWRSGMCDSGPYLSILPLAPQSPPGAWIQSLGVGGGGGSSGHSEGLPSSQEPEPSPTKVSLSPRWLGSWPWDPWSKDTHICVLHQVRKTGLCSSESTFDLV